jgi:hypothetical protein
LLLYALIGGIACKHAFYDGTARGILNMVGVFIAGGFALAFAINRLESKVRERKARPASWEAHQEHRSEREAPPVSPVLVWGRRAVFVAVPLFPVAVYWLTMALDHPRHGQRGDLPFKLAFAATIFGLIGGAFALADFDRRIARSGDTWRAARRARRHPERATPRRVAVPSTTPRGTSAEGRRIHRATADGSAIRRRPPGRARVHSMLEWFLVAYLILGLPSVLMAFPGPSGFVAFITIGFTLLAITNRVDTWASEPIWTPGNAHAEERRQQRIETGGNWWAIDPPRYLRVLRGTYLSFVILGFLICLVWPFLNSWTPEEKYPYAAVYLGGFLGGLALLGYAERHQRARESEWLEQRKSDRQAARD